MIGHIEPMKDGYGDKYITDLDLFNCKIGSGSRKENGTLRLYLGSQLQIYLNNTWNNITSNINFNHTLEFTLNGTKSILDVMTGRSKYNIGINGLPITNQYKTVMGACGFPSITGGRNI